MGVKQLVCNLPPTILIVEALPSVAKALRISLRAAGFDVAEATAGGQALQMLEQQPIDAVVVHAGLPDGLGKALLDRLRQADECSFAAWVVISALDREEATRRYGPLGGHFLAKPFNPWDLVRTLKEFLSERNGGQHR